jgi:NAD(P)-dependent dehydrogenase (short-subunit alcohol dehydrogenase family)
VDTATFDDWEFVYRTNTASLYFMTTAFVPLLARAASDVFMPAVINITSINGLIRRSLGHFAANSAKAAAIHVTKMLATELAAAGLQIRVNSIAPGVFPSVITAGKPADPVNANKSDLPPGSWGTAEILAGRPGSDVDMAGAVLFIATNQYLHGQIINLDGGYLVQHGTL